MPDPTFTTPPDAPSRASPSTFSSRTDAFLAWMVTFKSELVTAVSWFSSTAATVSTDASTTEAAKQAAIAAANAAPWVSAASYTALDVVISPVDYQPYRAITTHSGVTTDPSLDATNWVQLYAGFSGSYDDLTDVPAPPSALLAVIGDSRASGTAGGATTANTWMTRTINTEFHDPNSVVTVSSNEFTLTTDCVAIFKATAYKPNWFRHRILRVSDSFEMGISHSQLNQAAQFESRWSEGVAILSSGVAYRLETRCSSADASGLGNAATMSPSPEIYAVIEFWSR